MKTAIRCCVLLALCVSATSAPRGENTHYQLSAKIDTVGMVLSATATISVSGARGDSLWVALPFPGSVTVEGVTGVDGSALGHATAGGNGLLAIHAPGGGQVTVRYTIPIDKDPEPYGYHMFSDPTGNRWYPQAMNADGTADHFSDFDVTLEFPEDFGVLTSGGYGDRSAGEGNVVARYSLRRVQDFAVVVGAGFRVTRHGDGAVPVIAFYQPDYEEMFSSVAVHTAEALEWYTGAYGFFPVPFMGVVQGHPRWGGGYPLTNMFMVHLGVLRDDFLAFITAHELGHYYWGLHVVGDREYLDWLVLANGIWADQLYLAQRSGRTLEEQWRHAGNGDWLLDFMRAVVANLEQNLDLTKEEVAEAGLRFDYNSFIRHGKGAAGVHLQARLAGTETFLALQRRILEEYRHRPLPVDAFIELLNGVAPADTRPFFDAWRRGDARIDAVVESVEPLESGSGFQVAIRRTGNVPYPIDFEVDQEDGGTVRHRLAADAGTDTVTTESRPLAVRFDPEGVIPMQSGAHPGIKSLWIRALHSQKMDGTFVPLAKLHLADHPEDDELRYRLARRLFWLGRWEEGAALWESGRNCDGRRECLAGIYAARSLGRLGRAREAIAMLGRIGAGCQVGGCGLVLGARTRRGGCEGVAGRRGRHVRSPSDGRDWQRQREGAPLAGLRFDGDVPVVFLRHLIADGQPQPGSDTHAPPGVTGVEDPLDILSWDPTAVVGHAESDFIHIGLCGEALCRRNSR